MRVLPYINGSGKMRAHRVTIEELCTLLRGGLAVQLPQGGLESVSPPAVRTLLYQEVPTAEFSQQAASKG